MPRYSEIKPGRSDNIPSSETSPSPPPPRSKRTAAALWSRLVVRFKRRSFENGNLVRELDRELSAHGSLTAVIRRVGAWALVRDRPIAFDLLMDLADQVDRLTCERCGCESESAFQQVDGVVFCSHCWGKR